MFTATCNKYSLLALRNCALETHPSALFAYHSLFSLLERFYRTHKAHSREIQHLQEACTLWYNAGESHTQQPPEETHHALPHRP
jgi:hypothetical protein